MRRTGPHVLVAVPRDLAEELAKCDADPMSVNRRKFEIEEDILDLVRTKIIQTMEDQV